MVVFLLVRLRASSLERAMPDGVNESVRQHSSRRGSSDGPEGCDDAEEQGPSGRV